MSTLYQRVKNFCFTFFVNSRSMAAVTWGDEEDGVSGDVLLVDGVTTFVPSTKLDASPEDMRRRLGIVLARMSVYLHAKR